MLEDITALLLTLGKDKVQEIIESGEEINAEDFSCENIALILGNHPESVKIIRNNETNPSDFNPKLTIAVHPENYHEAFTIYALFSVLNNLNNGSETLLKSNFSYDQQLYNKILGLLTNSSQDKQYTDFDDFLNHVRNLATQISELSDSTESSEHSVAGSDTQKSGSMSYQTLEKNAQTLGIKVTNSIPLTNTSTKYTIIDSDQYPIILADDRDDITTINLDIQGETASCGDNALIFAAKAKQAGFDASILVQNGHAVVLIAHQENFSLDEILNTKIADSESLWQQYKNAFLNSFESSKLIEFLKDFIQFASIDIASKSYFPPYFDPPADQFFNSNNDDDLGISAILMGGNSTDTSF